MCDFTKRNENEVLHLRLSAQRVYKDVLTWRSKQDDDD